MKFLCGHCKAKYQIADAKAAGRTLRMNCRNCHKEIIIRGKELLAPPPPAGAAALSGAQPATGEPTARAGPWHVAIDDVPVGPMSQQALLGKLAAGEITGESLVWREGLEDWSPLAALPELGDSPGARAPDAHDALPAPPSSHASSLSPSARASTHPPSVDELVSSASIAPEAWGSTAAAAAPAAAPATRSTAAPSVPDVASRPSVAALPSTPSRMPDPDEHTPQRSGWGWGPLFLMVCAGAFIMMLGSMVTFFMLRSETPADPAPTTASATPRADAVQAPPEPEQPAVVELELQEIDGEYEQADDGDTTRAPARRNKRATKEKKPAKPSLSEEDKRMLARMGAGAKDRLPTRIRTSPSDDVRTGGGGQGLSAAQLSRVIGKRRKELQRCYESAARRSPHTDTLKISVKLTVAPSGSVTRVDTQGARLQGLDACIERTARMWRFPSAGDSTETKFPLVFQPGA